MGGKDEENVAGRRQIVVSGGCGGVRAAASASVRISRRWRTVRTQDHESQQESARCVISWECQQGGRDSWELPTCIMKERERGGGRTNKR